MKMAEVRIAPDGEAVAINRGELWPDELRWGVMTKNNGGHYTNEAEVADWVQAREDTG
jgi:hypothetical protein